MKEQNNSSFKIILLNTYFNVLYGKHKIINLIPKYNVWIV